MTRLELDMIPAQIFEDLTPEEEWRIAFESNEDLHVTVPQDWTDHAEFIWRLTEMGKKQTEIAAILGWKRESVKDYVALSRIASEAWEIIVGATKKEFAPVYPEEDAPTNGATAPKIFTAGLLRSIINLTAEQQIKLVKALAAGSIDKKKFKAKAERHRAKNEMMKEDGELA